MALFTWSDKYAVGVKSLDDQHKGLVAILNDLHAAMMKGQAQSITGPLLKKLVGYTHDHFATEERLLGLSKYPTLPQHTVIHRELTKQVGEFVGKYERGEVTVNLALLTFLRDWLATHIQKEDKEYGPWLNQHGIT
jgi:hemerythrin